MTRTAGREPAVVSITDAAVSLRDDQRSRQRTYLTGMLVRSACFVLAVIVTGPARWALVAGAVLLPYVSVVVANAGRESLRRLPLRRDARPALPAGARAE